MNKTAEKDIATLQGNPAKSNTRILIACQGMEWINKGNIKEVKSATLPADQWIFENNFLTLSEVQAVNKPSINFYCAESKPKVFKKALKKMPQNGNLYKGDFENMVKGQVEWKSGLGYHSETLKPQKFNFMWADYCKNATAKDAKEFANMTASMPNNSIAYITYGVMCRREGGQKALARKFRGYTNGSTDIHKAVRGMTTYLVRCANRGRKIQPIFDVVYGGGSRGGSTMLVLGYAIGMKHNLNPIVKNMRDEKLEVRSRNYSILNRIESGQIISTHKGFMSRVKLHKKTNKKSVLIEKKKIRIIKFIKRGWDSERIAKKFKVAVRTIGGMKAWVFNRKSWK